MKVAICASEMVPYAKTGGLADVVGALPVALEEVGQEVVVLMPCYRSIRNGKFNIHRLKEDIFYADLGENIEVYFIENDSYFNRDGLYTDNNGNDYKDNLERFSYYCKRSLRLLKELDFIPDIIHCHDWQASLIPVYLKTIYADDSAYKDVKTMLTIHNIGYQGIFSEEEFYTLGLDRSLFNLEMLEFYGKLNLLKGGIVFSDIINTVSSTYSKEIQTKKFGFGLEGVLSKRRNRLFGILNGLDYSIWNPETDKFIASKYCASYLNGKQKDKQDLQKICGLPEKPDIPLFGIVSRLAEHKGFDLLAEIMDTICRLDLQIVILGTGDLKYHQILTDIAKKYPKSLSLHLKFDDALAHKIYAGSDIFLMPSRYEPCGLGQMISLRYGSIPLVFKTGGLADTVTGDCGFAFDRYKSEDLLKTVGIALKSFANKNKWSKLINNAMKCDFSWEKSAREYVRLYYKAKVG